MKRRKQKPLATIRGRVNASIYKAKFQPFESTKYLNVAALKKARKVPIQIGTIEAAGRKVTVEAEVRKGLITNIRPVGCENCGPLKSKGKASGAFKKMAREVLKRVRDLGKPAVKLPIPISHLARSHIDFGPVVVDWVGGEMCITVTYTDGVICIWCQNHILQVILPPFDVTNPK